jgi:hypothetical protein
MYVVLPLGFLDLGEGVTAFVGSLGLGELTALGIAVFVAAVEVGFGDFATGIPLSQTHFLPIFLQVKIFPVT